MKKGVKTVLKGAGAAVAGMAAVGAATYASTKYMVKIAMDRKQPRIPRYERVLRRLRGGGECESFLEQAKIAGEHLASFLHETVALESFDGTHLVGHWYAHPNAKRVIVALHGWRSSWDFDFGTIAPFWHDCGCSVLYAEQRAQGESDGEYIGFGLLERFDCLEWVQWVSRQTKGKLPVYLAGVSMGATTVLMAAGLELPECVKGIMADCGFTSAHDIWKHIAENNLHLRYRMHQSLADRACRGRIQFGTQDYSTLDAMEKCQVPVLFAHGSDDRFVPVSMTYENYKACRAPKRLLIVPGADHGMSHHTEPCRYEEAMLNFWREFA